MSKVYTTSEFINDIIDFEHEYINDSDVSLIEDAFDKKLLFTKLYSQVNADTLTTISEKILVENGYLIDVRYLLDYKIKHHIDNHSVKVLH